MSLVVLSAELLYGDAGSTADTLLEGVIEVTTNMEVAEIDVTSRDSNGHKEYVPGLTDSGLDVSIWNDSENEGLAAIRSAFLNKTAIALFASDGNGNGLDADWMVTSYNVEEPLEDAAKVSCSFKPMKSTRKPVYVESSSDDDDA